jgi:hypothetical protein
MTFNVGKRRPKLDKQAELIYQSAQKEKKRAGNFRD